MQNSKQCCMLFAVSSTVIGSCRLVTGTRLWWVGHVEIDGTKKDYAMMGKIGEIQENGNGDVERFLKLC